MMSISNVQYLSIMNIKRQTLDTLPRIALHTKPKLPPPTTPTKFFKPKNLWYNKTEVIKIIKKQEEGCDSQFIYGCNTTWNLNHEFIKWVNYWFKRFKEEAEIDLTFHKFKYNNKEYNQIEIINRIRELTDYIDLDFYDFSDEERAESVEEVFDLFKTVFWAMWW